MKKSMRKKVLVCMASLGHGGAEDIIQRLCNGLINDFEIDLLLIQRCDEDKERVIKLNDKIKIGCLFNSSSSTTSIKYKVRNYLSYFLSPLFAFVLFRKKNLRSYHLIHVNLTQFALYSIIWKYLFSYFNWPGRIIQTFHTNQHLLKKLSLKIFRKSWSFCDYLVIEIDRSELDKVHPYIDVDKTRFIPFAVQDNADQFINKKTGPVQWGSLARLRLFEKKYEVILEALKKLKDEGVDFIYHIGGDGPDREIIENLVKDLGLQGNVIFHGYIVDPSIFFSKIDGLIVATVGDETGIAGLQALSYGIPLVGIDTLAKGNKDKNKITFKKAGTSTELSNLLKTLNDRKILREYYTRLRYEKDSYIGDKEMIKSYSNLYREATRPKVDLAFMADYGRSAGKGLEVESILNALINVKLAGVCTVRSKFIHSSHKIRNAHWTKNYIHRALTVYQKYIWKSFPARYVQEILFDWSCSKYYSRQIVPTGQILYLVPRMPRTIRAAKLAGYQVILHAVEMSPEYNIKILNDIYGPSQKWPSIWNIAGLYNSAVAVKNIDGIIAHTEASKKTYLNMMASSDNIDIIPMGYEERFLSSDKVFSSDDGITRYLYLGNVTKMKGSHLLLNAWEMVSDKLSELHICGEIYEDMMPSVIAAKQKYNNIFFHGYVDPSTYFKKCDIFVFPSLSESFGRAMLEAAVSGLPILCTRDVALNGLYEIKEFGFYFDSNVGSIAEAMNKIKHNKFKQAKMGMNAKYHFQNLTWEKFGENTVAVLVNKYVDLN
jgi:glycosyltransferase involved in cell wall biosynthesis